MRAVLMTQADFGLITMLVGLLMTTAVPTETQAGSIEFRGDTAYISGKLTFYDELYKRLLFPTSKELDIHTVSLNSEGGNLLVSIFMAQTIAERMLHTRVERGHLCVSGCLYLLLAGIRPTVHRNARV